VKTSSFDLVVNTVNSLWTGPHTPSVSIDGSKVKLTHPFGQTVSFDLTRHDLPDNVAAKVSAAIDALKAKEG
jgi:hypothetical protein